jgi:hypothetical protein
MFHMNQTSRYNNLVQIFSVVASMVIHNNSTCIQVAAFQIQNAKVSWEREEKKLCTNY